ncbi:MAG: hypothetical protein GEU82_06000 [Luteitalea sp.]|nr:hypothetical protein [Luteitalea sp.]
MTANGASRAGICRDRYAGSLVSQIFRDDIGDGAIFEAVRILNGFHERMAGDPHPTFNPGAILGGAAVTFDAATGSGGATVSR